MEGRWTNGRPLLVGGWKKNAALDGVFKNANSFLVAGNHINKVNLSLFEVVLTRVLKGLFGSWKLQEATLRPVLRS